MDFDMESARHQQAEHLGTRFHDVASFLSHRGKASLVLHGFFVLPASHAINPTQHILQPEPDPSELRAVLSNEAYGTDLEPVQDAALDANFEFDLDFLSQFEAGPGQVRMAQPPFTNLFTEEFSPANPNKIFSSDMPSQEYEFLTVSRHQRLLQPYQKRVSHPTTTTSQTHCNAYSLNIPGQETALSSNFETNSCGPSSSLETSFSSTCNDFSLNSQNLSEIFAGPEQKLSEEFETNHPDNQATHLTTPLTPSIQALHTSPPSKPTPPPASSGSPISPDRHTCPYCPRTFKRPGDVKRHEKVHIPGQRRFHCWKVGRERKGWRGFYRRDKLRDHVKTVHWS